MYKRAWSLVVAATCVANLWALSIDLLRLRKYRRHARDVDYEQWWNGFKSTYNLFPHVVDNKTSEQSPVRTVGDVLSEFLAWNVDAGRSISSEELGQLVILLNEWESELREALR